MKYAPVIVAGTAAKGRQLSLKNTTLDMELLEKPVMQNDVDPICLWKLLMFHLNCIPPEFKSIFYTVKQTKDITSNGVGVHYTKVMGSLMIGQLNRNLMIQIGIDCGKAQRITNQGNRKCLATTVVGNPNLSDRAKAGCLDHTTINTSSKSYQCARNHRVESNVQHAMAAVAFTSPVVQRPTNPYHRVSLNSKNLNTRLF